jgi:S-DNA-T family DNA segregation ATPase FtsK/SpoIIIE
VLGHGLYPIDDFTTPASLSKRIATDLLRRELRFRGLAITDDLADPAVTAVETVPDVVLVVAGTAAELSAAYRGPVPALRRRRSGLLLSPAPGDADLLGIRLPRTPVPARPGSGWLVVAGAAERVQVARRDPPPDRVPAAVGTGACSAAW